ncbi:PAP2 superfamily C-terminal-domain-containing protein [Gilbertella persicaria]|uniref:PAP2 superfamily C-terminal-domain-containing protein n=1 Tax=Gilbertella persicaria TaxID=101096 RepID=UPI0022200F10|nr:PAP2 superfamily C-terminal-domain-containing protein [Gilbertella persicaria]KAI8057565.1 PAP2 superfamily C-terminal-domain-containing protein [Gilbertella persicaria]
MLKKILHLTRRLNRIEAKEAPSVIARLSHEKQTIGFLKLRLSPPSQIRSLKDVGSIFMSHEFARVLLVFIWLVICGLIETFMAQLSDMRYYALPEMSKHPLRDLLHDAFPRVADTQIVNYLLTMTLLYTLVGFAVQSPDWSTRFMILRRFGFIMGFIYVFRGITLLVTTLPSSLIDECRPPEIELTGTVAQRFGFLFSVIGGSALTCTDNIFSGHTSMMMSCCMVWRVHSKLRRPFAWILYLIATAGILMILFTRFHYSIDVVLAIYITYTAWNIYLRYIQEASVKYMFGFTNHSTLEVFQSHLTSDAALTYEYLNWQPHPLGKHWLMWFFMYIDGLDIRLRAIGVFDEYGAWKKEYHKPSMVEKKSCAIV